MVREILVTESQDFSPAAAGKLRKVGQVVLANLSRAELLTAVAEADVLWIRLRHRIDAEVLEAAPNLRIIASPTTGLTHIDQKAAAARGVEIVSLRGETAFLKDVRATAEHTIGLILTLLRRIPAAVAHVREGGWDRDQFKGYELFERTVGIVGYGRLGRLVARYLSAFGMRVLAADPHVRPEEVEAPAQLVSMETLLAEADIVTLHMNHSDETHRFFGREAFGAMRVGAWFINTSRGELVDEYALLEALESGRIRGAALDVLDSESSNGMSTNTLVQYARNHDNLIITPHIGGCTGESLLKAEDFLAEKLIQTLMRDSVAYS